MMYKLLYYMHTSGVINNPWISFVQSTFDEMGASYMFDQQSTHGTSLPVFKMFIKQRLEDQFKQKWSSELESSKVCLNYKMYKSNLCQENYLLCVPDYLKIPFTKFRLANNKLPVIKLSYNNIPRNERLCTLCQSGKIGDEFHYALECEYFKNQRENYIKKYFCKKPNVLKFNSLMNVRGLQLLNLCKFVKIIINSVP